MQHAARRSATGEIEIVNTASDAVEVTLPGSTRLPQFRIGADRRAFLAREVRFRDSDVVVATYPKCGTTVLEQMVLLLLHGGDASKLNPAGKNTWHPEAGVGKVWPEIHVWPAASKPALQIPRDESGARVIPRMGNAAHDELDLLLTPEEFDAVPARRVLKSHFNGAGLLELFPQLRASDCKILTVLRDPAAACVSAYHHCLRFLGTPVTLQQFVPLYLSGLCWDSSAQPWGTLAEASRTYQVLEAAMPERVLVLRYEQLVADPHATVRRVAAHLGVPADDALVDAVVRDCHFDAMKERSAQAQHFRKGPSGSASEELAAFPGLEEALQQQYKASCSAL